MKKRRYDSTGSAIGFGLLGAAFSPWVLAYYGVKLLQEIVEDFTDNLSEDEPEVIESPPEGPDGVYVNANQVFNPDNRRN